MAILLLVMCAVHMFQRTLDAVVLAAWLDLLGCHWAGLMQGRLWQLLSYQFLHGSWSHLALNLVTLLSVGREMERSLGVRGFLFTYMVSGVCGALCWLLIVYPGDSVLVGASAAICGLLGALAACRPREKYTILFLPLPLPAWLLISLLAAIQVAWMLLDRDSQVAFPAHLAGGAAGWAIGRGLRRRPLPEPRESSG